MKVEIEVISAKALYGKSQSEKLAFILNAVKKNKNKILVLEEPLSRSEEKDLISKTMPLVSKDFPGIEIASIGEEVSDLRSQFLKFLGGKTTGLTVIGPSKLVRQVKRDPNSLSLTAGR